MEFLRESAESSPTTGLIRPFGMLDPHRAWPAREALAIAALGGVLQGVDVLRLNGHTLSTRQRPRGDDGCGPQRLFMVRILDLEAVQRL